MDARLLIAGRRHVSNSTDLPRLALLVSFASACDSPMETTTSPPPPLTGAAPFFVSNSVTNGSEVLPPMGTPVLIR